MVWSRGRIVWISASAAGVVLLGVIVSLFFITSSSAACQSRHAYQDKSVWVELGTNSGPIPNPLRSEPAHLLLWHDQLILIDAGDGVSEQLAKAHVPLGAVQMIFLSHLHFDHTGGLFGLLGMRYQGAGPGCNDVTIFGPPGTSGLVNGLRAAFQSGSALASSALPTFHVFELNDGSKLDIGGIHITAATNSHYDLWKGNGPKPVSLSYRFVMPDRSIVYTGDTGPSRNVEVLAHGADMLVSEIMDADTALNTIKSQYPLVPGPLFSFVHEHFIKEHLGPDQVGLLAAHAGVRRLVLTHFGGATGSKDQITRLTKTIASHYKGPIHFARDLERF